MSKSTPENNINMNLYVTLEQYLEFRQFYIENYFKQVEFLGNGGFWLNSFTSFEIHSTKTLDITHLQKSNTDIEYVMTSINKHQEEFCLMYKRDTTTAMWFFHNCNLSFVRQQIEEEYDNCWWMKVTLDFTKGCHLLNFKVGESLFCTYTTKLNIDEVALSDLIYLEKCVIYGDTAILNTLDEAVQICAGNPPSELLNNESSYVEFSIFGNLIYYANGEYFLAGEDKKIEPVSLADSDIAIPKIEYSIKVSDCERYDHEEIIICESKVRFYALNSLRGFGKHSKSSLIRRQVPSYILNILK